MSYTEFAYSTLEVSDTRVQLKLKNTGKRPGAEVVQLYISANKESASVSRPEKELKGFAKVFLLGYEERLVTIPLDRFATSFWDELEEAWVSEQGTYKILVGNSSSNILLQGELQVREKTLWTGL